MSSLHQRYDSAR